MGKKSKRHRSGGGGQLKQAPPAQRDSAERGEETADNLQFEDPFCDEIVHDEELDGESDPDHLEQVQTLNPYVATEYGALEIDPAAYKMHHSLRGEWPSLSFSFLRDLSGEGRTRFPHSLAAVVGTQADVSSNNSVQIWRLSDLGKIETDEDEEDEDYDKPASGEDDSDDDVDYDPILETSTCPHDGGVNRLRIQQKVVATWSDAAMINFYTLSETSGILKPPKLVSTYTGHNVEGFAMDFSSTSGRLVTGDNDGNIHVFERDYSLGATPHSSGAGKAVEDLQWSPTEATVLAAGEESGLLKIYDTRAPNKVMVSKTISSSDVNAVAWSPLVTNLLATGSDDGAWSVWDLRKLSEETPLAKFTSHRTPITSMEWHATDESMLVVSDEVGSFVYDLSVEEESEFAGGLVSSGEGELEIPPQLLFSHTGSPHTKEVHWHPQITSCLMSTAYDGFHVFIPSNL